MKLTIGQYIDNLTPFFREILVSGNLVCIPWESMNFSNIQILTYGILQL